jgi:hypothetical protein
MSRRGASTRRRRTPGGAKIGNVQTFGTAREAKEFLVTRIVTEAQRENVPMSAVERKMLYFSETAWTLPDIAEVNEAFDREYDQAEYERKIANLIRKLSARARAEDREELDVWREAVRTLKKEDHYLLVMIAAAEASGRPRGDFLKLLATALAIVAVLLAIIFLTASR